MWSFNYSLCHVQIQKAKKMDLISKKQKILESFGLVSQRSDDETNKNRRSNNSSMLLSYKNNIGEKS